MIRIFFILLLIIPTLLCAQAPAEESLLQALPPTFMPTDLARPAVAIVGPVGTTDLLQDGINHQAIIQTQDSYVQVQQIGEANLLKATQQGVNGQLRIRQDGINNQYTGTVVGDNNRLDITQNGQDHLIRQDLVGNDLFYRITQEGQGHELIQIEHDPLAPAYEVHQQGQGMQIVIEQGFVGIPPQEP